MFKKSLLTAVCLASFCYADNFIIDSIQDNGAKKQPAHQENEYVAEQQQEKLPQRIVVEDINPSSELGQLVGTMLKNEKKKAVVVAKPKPKPVVKKKKVVKKKPKSKSKVVKKHDVKKDVVMEIKSEEASKVDEHQKKEAEHNENNSSLKKVSSSNVCD